MRFSIRDLGLKLEAQKADLEILAIDKGNKVPVEKLRRPASRRGVG